MDPVILSRWQFAITTIFHFFFVPVTLGLSLFLAVLETKYVTSGEEIYKKMVKFWGKIFLINFAIGVVTGIVQEFHFGLNWSEYARFMGDVFGAPLAIEGLMAFFLESTFIGVWIFGWDKLSPKAHAGVAWLIAIGSNLSALWILVANSFMQNPVGYAIRNGRAEMTDFWALVSNPNVRYQFPHVVTAGVAVGGFLIMSFSAWHLLKDKAETREFFTRSFRWAAIFALIGALLVGLIGHAQGQFLAQSQPLKIAAMEGHWETEAPASFSVIAIVNQEKQANTFEIKVPKFLSLMLFNDLSTGFKGLKELQEEEIAKYGPGNYIPPVLISYWSSRTMIGIGLVMVLIAILAVWWSWKEKLQERRWFLRMLILTGLLPTIAITAGWLIAETGRWPWIVHGLQKIEDAVSPAITPGIIIFSMSSFLVLYSVLGVIGVSLMLKYGKSDPAAAEGKGE
ncbi:MAG TPA: cytochrome ubiquinol oxidase subunit I [Chloroflexi bacterium]|nr:MAG: cytochrome ubiquinol oxidase subunit I [Chloroflexota bacterium]HDD55791.1 cytochrome ubiquinol oxidase subunit I [Chloroflexota bacterium]